MFETSQAPAASGGAPVVPQGLRCGFCGQPIQDEFFRAAERFCCGGCAFQIDAVRQLNQFSAAHFVVATIAGLIGAVACAAAWAAICISTRREWGFIAALVGYAVGKIVLLASGRRRGLHMQLLASGLAVLGILLGKLVLLGHALFQAIREQGNDAAIADVIVPIFRILRSEPQLVFGAYDVLWVLLAVWIAWTTCRPLRIDLAGPFPYRPAPLVDGLRFDVANPISPDSPSNQST